MGDNHYYKPIEAEEEISIEALEYLESKWHVEKEANNLKSETEFNYGWALIRSRNDSDIKKGINILEDSLLKFPENKRECLYYISIANYRLGKYGDARCVIQGLLLEEPNNKQFQSLSGLIDEKSRRDSLVGMAIVGGIVAASSAILISFLRRNNSH